MSLDALAPDQRAVVQLVLQQDRSYDDLAGLLGITTDAVRERARRGLERLSPGGGVDPDDRADVADYLLGQQSVSGREATRSLLAASEPARAWATAVAGELEGIARGPLPEVPGGETAPAVRPEPAATPESAAKPETAATLESAAQPEPAATPESAAKPEPATEPLEAPVDPAIPARARPRPRPAAATPRAVDEVPQPEPLRAAAEGADGPARPRSSLVGGGLLIGGLAVVLVALVVWLVNKGGDNSPSKTTSTGTSAQTTPTPAASPSFQQVGALDLTAAGGGSAAGKLTLYVSTQQQLAFTVQATGMPESRQGEAYGVWLTGGDKPHFLGFAPAVKADGKLGTSGPRAGDAKDLQTWLSTAKTIVVSRETQEGAAQPGPIVLSGDLTKATGTATPTATP